MSATSFRLSAGSGDMQRHISGSLIDPSERLLCRTQSTLIGTYYRACVPEPLRSAQRSEVASSNRYKIANPNGAYPHHAHRPVVDISDPLRVVTRTNSNIPPPYNTYTRGATFDPDASRHGPTQAELDAAARTARLPPADRVTSSPVPLRSGLSPTLQRTSPGLTHRGRSRSRSTRSSRSSNSDDGSRSRHSRRRRSRSRSRSRSRRYSSRQSPSSSRGDSPSLADSRYSSSSRRSRSPRRSGSTRHSRSRSPPSRRSSVQNRSAGLSSTNNSSPPLSRSSSLPVVSPVKHRRNRKKGPPPPDVEPSVEDPIVVDACGRYWHSMATTGLGFFPDGNQRTAFAQRYFEESNKAATDAGKPTIPYWHTVYRSKIDNFATNARGVIKMATENFPIDQYKFKSKSTPDAKRKWLADLVAYRVGSKTYRLFMHLRDEGEQRLRFHQHPAIALAWRELFILSEYSAVTLRFASTYERVPLETIALAATAVQFSLEYRGPDSLDAGVKYSKAKFEARKWGGTYRSILGDLRTAANADAEDEEHLGLQILRAKLGEELVSSRSLSMVPPENQITAAEVFKEHSFFALPFTELSEASSPPVQDAGGERGPMPMYATHPSALVQTGQWQAMASGQYQSVVAPPSSSHPYWPNGMVAPAPSYYSNVESSHAPSTYSYSQPPMDPSYNQASQQNVAFYSGASHQAQYAPGPYTQGPSSSDLQDSHVDGSGGSGYGERHGYSTYGYESGGHEY
ncbi:hypothetical protein PENSPDRAFT_672568 [Peniophora sp. CONT]|nr:hypothetical protein PENSPDRAFT_672568 [Peniophora sp. CONT]